MCGLADNRTLPYGLEQILLMLIHGLDFIFGEDKKFKDNCMTLD